ncbi:MAG: dimethylamine monooxygenase subunit DmmA family protein [Mycobacterium sp.]
MKPALETTSVPGWSTAARRPDADLSGRSWTVVGFGPDAQPMVSAWQEQILGADPAAAIMVHLVDEADGDRAAAQAVDTDLADALVGWRLMIGGPADACLRLRAHALRRGVGDDEIVVGSTAVATRDVLCAHCQARTRAEVGLEEVLPCAGCGRNLFVYYHVSRLKGAHLGFMVDAEQMQAAEPVAAP